MSIAAKPWEGGGSASVPDASETTKGKIRIATSSEAATGTDDLTAMTPLTVKERIDASLVGGVEYKGTFNATAGTPSLLNAEQGDLYVIDVAGTIYGQDWSIGDQLLINADMGGTISNGKINKVDNTDTPASETVAGVIEIATDAEAGAGTETDKALVPSNVSSLSIASSQVTGLATVATSGAYADISGTPPLGTAAAQDVGEDANDVVQLDASARLPAVDGSQLTNLPSGVTQLNDLSDVSITGASTGEVLRYSGAAWVDATLAYADISGTPTLATVATTGDYADVLNTPDLSIYAPLASPALSGSPTAPTQTQSDGSDKLATTSYVDTAVAAGGGGGGGYTYSPISATTTAQASYHYSVDTSAGAVTLNLPALADPTDGEEIRVKLRVAGNDLTIDANGTETIDGAQTLVLSVATSSVTLVVGSTEWEVV